MTLERIERIEKRIANALSEAGNIHNAYALTVAEFDVLCQAHQNKATPDRLYYSIVDCYTYGFIRGMRAERAKQKKNSPLSDRRHSK